MSVTVEEIIQEQINQNKKFYSIELTPKPGELVDLQNFLKVPPLFVSITWIGDTNLQCNDVLDSPAVQLLQFLKNKLPVLLHLSCFQLTEDHLDKIVNVTDNFFPLTGDQSFGKQNYKDAKALVQAIISKKSTNANLTIATSGYPPCNYSNEAVARFKTGLNVLKIKIDAGANLIITQAIYEAELFFKFVQECRDIGITLPILPGIYVPNNYSMFLRMQKITGTVAPETLSQKLESVKEDEVEFQKVANDWVVKLIKDLFSKDLCHGVHFFTMNNLEQINTVVNQTGLLKIAL